MQYTHAMTLKIGIAFFSLAAGLCAQSAGDAWWAHVQALAAPEMEGRLTGSEGYLRAARYVVAQFDSAGLQPAGDHGYYQPVKFEITRVLAAQSSMTLVSGGRKEPLVLGRDANLGSRGSQPKGSALNS
jgi:hypothetical protein